jgi:DegV family protein with EDD domain
MKIKVITDSTADIPQAIVDELDIAVVPIYLRFGEAVYRDNVDLKTGDFYERLDSSPVHPATSQPPPEDFINCYGFQLKSASGVVSIHVSSKISGTYNSALLAKKIMEEGRLVEVLDSQYNSAGLGLVAMAAARLAKAGVGMAEVLAEAKKTISEIRMFGMFNTMKYLSLSGRVSRSIATVADFLDVKPLLTFRDGEIVRAGFVRTFSKGLDRLYDYVAHKANIQEMFIVHSAVPEWAESLKQRLANILPIEKINISHLGAALGVHGGKGVLLVALRQAA